MGSGENLFGGINMQEIQSTNDYQQMMEGSTNNPVLLFKHSTTCPISAAAYEQYQTFLNSADANKVNPYLIKVIENREISNQVEADTGVKHESPQIFLIKNKDVLWHTSHSDITADNIKNQLSHV